MQRNKREKDVLKREGEKKGRKRRRRQQNKAAEAQIEGFEKAVPVTLDNARVPDETIPEANDEEVTLDEAMDEFSNVTSAKVMVTTSEKPRRKMFSFIGELLRAIPNSYYYKRGSYMLKDIMRFADKKNFSDVVVVTEHRRVPAGIIHSRLPEGPTATYKLSSLKLSTDIRGAGDPTPHYPELILSRFHTRLGRRVARMLGSMFPSSPEFEGRRVVTLHNQRDFVFFRHHRYVFDDDGRKVNLQELGPRFSLKLTSLQKGTFDTRFGEYEYIRKKKDLGASRRKFVL